MGTALAEGRSLEEAVRFGNAAGALSVTRRGTAPSMPTRTEIDKLLQQT
jgi:ribokinase